MENIIWINVCRGYKGIPPSQPSTGSRKRFAYWPSLGNNGPFTCLQESVAFVGPVLSSTNQWRVFHGLMKNEDSVPKICPYPTSNKNKNIGLRSKTCPYPTFNNNIINRTPFQNMSLPHLWQWNKNQDSVTFFSFGGWMGLIYRTESCFFKGPQDTLLWLVKSGPGHIKTTESVLNQ